MTTRPESPGVVPTPDPYRGNEERTPYPPADGPTTLSSLFRVSREGRTSVYTWRGPGGVGDPEEPSSRRSRE